MDLLLKGKAQCCGCGTCALVCPVGAIKMVPQELGCLYPAIDNEKCIECHRCELSCVYQTEREDLAASPSVYAAAAKNKELLKRSASGGVFAAVAYGILDAGGVVFGCSLELKDGKLIPMHIPVEEKSDLYKLQGSKYVQSKLGDTFDRIKKVLLQGRSVLFSGTPCQVDALTHYVRDLDCSKLYTIDIICHGVPSAKLFQEYISLLAKGSVTTFLFRDKTYGWGLNARYTVKNRRGKVTEQILPPGISSYYSYFLNSEIYRESCYSCKYASNDRVGDITIGDFWGFEEEHPEYEIKNGGSFDVHAGVSSVLVNTEKGKLLLERIGTGLLLRKSDPDKVIKWNRQLREPSKHSDVRSQIMKQYDQYGYDGVERLYRKSLGVRYAVRKAKTLLRRQLLKKI